jgi:hypothetical protein
MTLFHICVDWRDSWANLQLDVSIVIQVDGAPGPPTPWTGSALAERSRPTSVEHARLPQAFRII